MFASYSFDAARQQMVRQQLQGRGITAPRVLAAIARVPRERFVPLEEQRAAYADRALPIDCGQTISQPYIVGLMTQALELTGGEAVLEIGTGSGYQTAVLAELARRVVSVERFAELQARAAAVLQSLGYPNIQLVAGDGTLGCPEQAPYDRIVVTAAAASVPPALEEQLVEGGILVIPLGDAESQTLTAVRKRDGVFHSVGLSGCRFVPLIGTYEPRGEGESRPPE